MRQKILLAILLMAAVAVAGCMSAPANTGTLETGATGSSASGGAQCNDNGVCDAGETISQCPSECNQAQVTIVMSEAGFSPQEVTVTEGGVVTWVNTGGTAMWPASAFHPTHTVYPGSDINKCGTSDELNIFDSCRGIAPGGSWTFVFNDKGTWAYHDHLNPSRFGRVIVV
jgi:plastocyanin